MQPEKHKCGACDVEFATEQKYFDHKCSKSGHKPTQIEHQDSLTGGAFSKQSEKALERGRLKQEKKAKPRGEK